jgi:hypothetical protein
MNEPSLDERIARLVEEIDADLETLRVMNEEILWKPVQSESLVQMRLRTRAREELNVATILCSSIPDEHQI